jgi:hypothetical protein
MMSNALAKIASELSEAKIDFDIIEGKIHVPLPNDFDTLVIEIWKDEEDSITLLNGCFHTHGDIEAREYGLSNREKGIRHLIESIFNGEFKMVKRKNQQGKFENTIWDTFSLAVINDDIEYEFIGEI